MFTLCVWIILFAIIFTLAFFQTSAMIWVPVTGLLFFFYTYFHIISYIPLTIFWVVWAATTLILLLAPLRRHYLIKPFIHWFRKQQPELSNAEQQVLDAGGLWWEKNFFKPKINWQDLEKIKPPKLTEEEQHFIDHQVKTLCDMLIQAKVDIEKNILPRAIWSYIKKEKFWGLMIPKKYGGLGFSAIAHSTIIAKLAARSYSAALTVMVPNSLGPGELISCYGSEQQKTQYLSKLAAGLEVPCFALTAPQAGSDATSLTDTGVVCKGKFQGEEIIGIKLNWEKRYITLAPVATLIGLAFRMQDPDHLLGDKKEIGITLALVPSHLPGIEIGKRHNPLNLGFLNGPIRGRDVFIPLDYIIGGVARRGEGWQMMMECLAVGRGISLPALSAAMSQLCFRTTGAYSQVREQFRRAIGSFDGVKAVLARIGGFTYLCEATRLFTATAVDAGARPAVASAIAKYHLTELSRKVLADAMDIHGGRGIQLGSRNYLGFLHSCTPVSITVEGANILTRNLIIFGQGAIRCHPYLREEIAAADPNNKKKVKQFDRLIRSHIGLVSSLFCRVFAYGVTAGYWIRSRQIKPLKGYNKQLTRMASAFNLVTNMTMGTLGSELKIKETMSARLGDILSHLYMASAVLKYFYDNNENKEDLIFLEWSLGYCLHQIEIAFYEFFTNFPKRWLAIVMRFIVFPWGRQYGFPKDALSFQIAEFMQKPSGLRDRLTRCCYISDQNEDPVRRIEHALHCLTWSKSLLTKLRKKYGQKLRQTTLARCTQNAYNEGLLNDSERDQLLQLEQTLRDAIQVDEYAAQQENITQDVPLVIDEK